MPPKRSPNPASAPLPDAIKDSAHEIWLAGLAAFSKAQQEGSKVFDALVQEGLTIQRKTQTAAEEKITAATQKMNALAQDVSTRATGQWDKLESIFEDRVARALNGLGVPTAQELQTLSERLTALEQVVAKQAPSAKAAKKAPARPRTTTRPST